jgi:amidase
VGQDGEMTALADLTARELAAAIRRGEVSPLDAVESALALADRLGASLGAFVHLTPEAARAEAREAERLLGARGRAGRAIGAAGDIPPFLGVPAAVKDLNLVAGVPTRFGSAALAAVVPERDDGVVTKLRAAGCVLVGKTTTPELGLPCYTEPDIGPPARTPWDLRRSAGGSSGGSAAAVAAGIVPVALGSDGGGSIRIPASACGLVGLKPTRGRISWGPLGVDGAGLAALGVLTRDVRDTAAFLDVLSGPWPGDQFLLPGPRTTYLDACERPSPGLRIGVLTAPVIDRDAPVHPACLDAVDVVAAALDRLGHRVDAAGVPFAGERWESFRVLWTTGAASVAVEPEQEANLAPLTRWLREQGRLVTGVDYVRALVDVQRVAREVAESWGSFDVVVCPTLAQPPAPVGSQRNDLDPAADFAAQVAFTPWTSLWNLTGAPAVSLPLHWAEVADDDGVPTTLPIGVMLGGRTGQEETLLGLAAELEGVLPWRDRRPPIR